MSRTYRRNPYEHFGFRCYDHKTGRTGDRHFQKGWGYESRVVGDRVIIDKWLDGPCGRWWKRRTSRDRRRVDKKIIRRELQCL